MKFESKLSCGDKVWYFDGVPVQITVGQIRISYTETPGLNEDDSFIGSIYSSDQPNPKQEIEEVYMCIETGIGSGSLLTLGKHIYLTEEECIEGSREEIQRQMDAIEWRRKNDEEQHIRQAEYHAAEAARISSLRAGTK